MVSVDGKFSLIILFLSLIRIVRIEASTFDVNNNESFKLLSPSYFEVKVRTLQQTLSASSSNTNCHFTKQSLLNKSSIKNSCLQPPIQTIINTDDRVHSNDQKLGRLRYDIQGDVSFNGTGFLVSNGFFLTAGHIVWWMSFYGQESFWFEFNIPPSKENGEPSLGPADCRFKIDVTEAHPIYPNQPVIGDDWGIFRVFPNPADKNKKSVFSIQYTSGFRLLRDWEARFGTNSLARITGYGLVYTPPGKEPFIKPLQEPYKTKNSKCGTEQTESGRIDKRITSPPNDTIYYQIDTTSGNSGSPVCLVGTNMAIAVHTTSFTPGENNNKGTGFKNTNFITTIKSFLTSENLRYVDGDYFAVSPTDVTGDNVPGGLFNPYRSLEDACAGAVSGDTLGITAGYYAGGGITFPLGKKLTLKALAGKVYIGSILFEQAQLLPPINPPSLAVSDTKVADNRQHEKKQISLAIREKLIRRHTKLHTQLSFKDPINKPDTRVLSNDPRVGKIIWAIPMEETEYQYIGTGFLISSGCILTSGRIFNNVDDLLSQTFYLQVNIDKNGSLLDEWYFDTSSPDVYKVITESIIWDQHTSPVQGDDWAVFRVNNNSQKESIFQNQKLSFRPITNWRASSATPDLLFGLTPYVRTTGHGQISDPITRYLIQQTNSAQVNQRNAPSTGEIDAIYSSINTSQSTGTGSAVYLIGTHMVIGISSTFTPPATPTDRGVDVSTGFGNTRLVTAIQNCFQDGKPLTYVDSDYFCVLAKHADGVTDGTGDIFAPYRRLEDAVNKSTSGSNLGIVAGYYANAGITFPLGKALSLKAISGKVYIGGILPQPGQQPPFGNTLTTGITNNKNKKESASVVPIKEPFAPASSSSGEEDLFSSLGDFGLPIGSVLDWWNTNISSMPACFELCNGQRVLDRESPLFGQYLPNLNHVFTRGTIDPQEVGQQGGHSKAVVSLKTSEDGAHRHQFSDNRGMTDLISRATTAQDIYMHERSAAASHNHGSWTHSQESGSSVSHRKGKGVNHRHSLPGTDSGGAHTHTITATVDISPPYVNVLKIMRIK